MKDVMDLTFALRVETDKEVSDLLEMLASNLSGAAREGGYIRYSNNLLCFEKTLSHDRGKIFLAEDPWLYYKYQLSVYPLKDENLEHQRQLAAELVSIMKRHAEFVELVAEFELSGN